jgi:hypothetical protein
MQSSTMVFYFLSFMTHDGMILFTLLLLNTGLQKPTATMCVSIQSDLPLDTINMVQLISTTVKGQTYMQSAY